MVCFETICITTLAQAVIQTRWFILAECSTKRLCCKLQSTDYNSENHWCTTEVLPYISRSKLSWQQNLSTVSTVAKITMKMKPDKSTHGTYTHTRARVLFLCLRVYHGVLLSVPTFVYATTGPLSGAIDGHRDAHGRYGCCVEKLILARRPVRVIAEVEESVAPAVSGQHQYRDVHPTVHHAGLYLHTDIQRHVYKQTSHHVLVCVVYKVVGVLASEGWREACDRYKWGLWKLYALTRFSVDYVDDSITWLDAHQFRSPAPNPKKQLANWRAKESSLFRAFAPPSPTECHTPTC